MAVKLSSDPECSYFLEFWWINTYIKKHNYHPTVLLQGYWQCACVFIQVIVMLDLGCVCTRCNQSFKLVLPSGNFQAFILCVCHYCICLFSMVQNRRETETGHVNSTWVGVVLCISGNTDGWKLYGGQVSLSTQIYMHIHNEVSVDDAKS